MSPRYAFLLCLPWLASSCGSSNKCGSVDKSYSPAIDPAQFVAVVDQPLFPLSPGAKQLFQEGDKTDEIEVLSETRTILGVPCAVVHDVVKRGGQVIEDTFDWYAQDRSGSVWYFGEATRELSEGDTVSIEGSWEAGVDGAKPGYIIQIPLSVGQEWRQEYYACHAEDKATVLATAAAVSVPAGSFTGCLKTHDFTPLDSSADEEKYYCPGAGNVLTVDKTTGEREELLPP